MDDPLKNQTEMLGGGHENNLFNNKESISLEDEGVEEDEDELDNAIEVLVSEKKVWEAAFNAAKLEIEEKNLEIESLKKLLNERSALQVQSGCLQDCNLLRGPFEANIDSNKAVVNRNSMSVGSKSVEDYVFEELVNIATEETRALDDCDAFVSKLESSTNIEDAYRLIFRTLVELRLNSQSQEERIESLNEELSVTQEAVQNLHKTIQDSQNSSRLVSVAYASQIKSLQEDLLNACKDIDFWREQCEQLNKKDYSDAVKSQEVCLEARYQEFDPTEWCNLGSGVNTLVQVEVSPDSYWWFISY